MGATPHNSRPIYVVGYAGILTIRHHSYYRQRERAVHRETVTGSQPQPQPHDDNRSTTHRLLHHVFVLSRHTNSFTQTRQHQTNRTPHDDDDDQQPDGARIDIDTLLRGAGAAAAVSDAAVSLFCTNVCTLIHNKYIKQYTRTETLSGCRVPKCRRSRTRRRQRRQRRNDDDCRTAVLSRKGNSTFTPNHTREWTTVPHAGIILFSG